MTNRRQILMAAAGVAANAPLSALARIGAPETDNFAYDYLFFELARGKSRTTELAAFLNHLKSAAIATITSAGGEPIGYFTPLLGWSSQNVAVVVRWKNSNPKREEAIASVTRHPSVRAVQRDRLAATARPAPTDLPLTRGIYTHRWFDVRTSDIPEFVALSERGWLGFEKDFASKVYGLFHVEQTAQEREDGVTRMLLNTQYDSLSDWQVSRRPAAETASAFGRRGELTITSRVSAIQYTALTAS